MAIGLPVCASAVHGATELQVFTVEAIGMGWGGCEQRLRSTPRYRLACNWFPAPGGGLPLRTWPGSIQVPRCRVEVCL